MVLKTKPVIVAKCPRLKIVRVNAYLAWYESSDLIMEVPGKLHGITTCFIYTSCLIERRRQ